MHNLYTPSKLLSKEEFEIIEKAFEKAWGKDTVFAKVKNEWNNRNKAYGQCLVTSIVVFDLFNGKLVYSKENKHYWNELPDETWQDFSRIQFKDKRDFSNYVYKTKDEVLYDETAIKFNTIKRYQLLKEKFLEYYNQ